jgi:hypothetical protein
MRGIETHELVKEECGGLNEVGVTRTVKTTKLFVRLDRCSARRKTENQIRRSAKCVGNATGYRAADLACSFKDDDVQRRQM